MAPPLLVAEHLGFELQKLSHETKIGGDDPTTLFDKVKGLLQFHPLALHQVR